MRTLIVFGSRRGTTRACAELPAKARAARNFGGRLVMSNEPPFMRHVLRGVGKEHADRRYGQ
jgi:hypothetical protein